MNKKSTQTPILAAAILLLVALILLIAYIIPKITTLKELNQEISQKEHELAVGKQKVQALRDAAQLIQQAKKEVELLGISIPTKEKAEESLLQITNIATRQNVAVTSASFDSAEGLLTMSVTAKGDYNKFVDFFNDINSNIRPVAVSGISFSVNEEDSGLEASFDLSFPYIAEESITEANIEGETATGEGGVNE